MVSGAALPSKPLQRGPPVLVRAATALQASWADAVRDLRETAGRLNVHGDELSKTIRDSLELVQAMICQRPSEELSKAGEWQGEVLNGDCP